VHLRHLAGGRFVSSGNREEGQIDEVIYRFEFPEAPGALTKFLDVVNFSYHGWSISLFHYRNHGHDVGHVLVGILLSSDDVPMLLSYLDKLGYTYYDETGNKAYVQFIR